MNTTIYYICNRSGSYNSKNMGKRVPVDYCKMGICPAYLKALVCHNTGKVEVHLMNTHVGDSQDLKFVPLPFTLKAQIASDIKDGIDPGKNLGQCKKKN